MVGRTGHQGCRGDRFLDTLKYCFGKEKLMNKTDKCPQCGCSEIGKGKMSGYASLTPQGKVFASSAIVAEVCTDCGLILLLRVEKPHIFKRK